MYAKLWKKVEAFQLDKPTEEYGFTVRLADENKWTRDFAERAILEYKKFMYLAAVSKSMVSPSEIVDIVWHQHLIFTQSYRDFCDLLGKQIQHIPSTHNAEEYVKFQQAKKLTEKAYGAHFGRQPADIWEEREMYAPLGLRSAKITPSTLSVAGFFAFIVLFIPAYLLLLPLYEQISGVRFLLGYLLLSAVVGLGLYTFNRAYLKGILQRFPQDSFLFRLRPTEVLYMFTGSLPVTLHGILNRMFEEQKIQTAVSDKVQVVPGATPADAEEEKIFKALSVSEHVTYRTLLESLISKPIFKNAAENVDAFKVHFHQSSAYFRMYAVNFVFLFLLVLLGAVRIGTGVMREKPSVYIIALTVIVLMSAANSPAGL